jgi:uncharacterized membrane protein
MEKFFGLPAHPLLVHIPVAMLPLAALGVGVMLIRSSWYERYKWAVLFIGAVGTVGAIIAGSTGEALQKRIGIKEGAEAARAVHDHAEAGDLAKAMAIVFFVALAAYILVPWYLHRKSATADASSTEPLNTQAAGPRWLRSLLMALVAVTAVVSMVTIVNAGHSGAAKAWEDLYTTEATG